LTATRAPARTARITLAIYAEVFWLPTSPENARPFTESDSAVFRSFLTVILNLAMLIGQQTERGHSLIFNGE